MTMLTQEIEFVVGVDTHRDLHAIAVIDRLGAVRSSLQTGTGPAELERAVGQVRAQAPGVRLWAIEGTGSFGAGLTRLLLAAGESVVEIDRPARPARRNGAKDDGLDAVRAAREALSRERLAEPRAGGAREALRMLTATRRSAVLARAKSINQLKALVVVAPDPVREQLRGLTTMALVRRCAGLRRLERHDIERQAITVSLRCTARRILALTGEIGELERDMRPLVELLAPGLLALDGVGLVTGAQVLISWSHHGRIRTEAAFAALGGAAPIPASSGQTHRHRLNRCGDRQLNRALHNIVLARARRDPRTRCYVARRTAEGKTTREIQRCLKRAVARQLFRWLNAHAATP